MHILTNTDILIRLLVAALLGGIVGYEREISGQDAGFRTHILVSVGAAIFTVLQLEAAEWVAKATMESPELIGVLSSDVTRLVSAIVSGIGFLGAGTIIVTSGAVKGLTTAASIWAIASIGMASGFGHFFLATVGTVIIYVVLHLVQRALHSEITKQIHVTYSERDLTFPRIVEYFESHGIHILRIEFKVDLTGKDGPISSDVFVVGIPRDHALSDTLDGLMTLPNLQAISIEKPQATN